MTGGVGLQSRGDDEAARDIACDVFVSLYWPRSLRRPTRYCVSATPERKRYREAAARLSISESTVKKHIIKALRTLRNLYSTYDAYP